MIVTEIDKPLVPTPDHEIGHKYELIKRSIDCESTIKKRYFDNAKGILKTDPCCYYCGVEGSSVLGLTKLQERCVTKGYNCFPTCIKCLDVKKRKAVTKGRQNVMQVRKEKERTGGSRIRARIK